MTLNDFEPEMIKFNIYIKIFLIIIKNNFDKKGINVRLEQKLKWSKNDEN